MTSEQILCCAALVAGLVGFVALRTFGRLARRLLRRLGRHLERRLVDVVLAVVLFRWVNRRVRRSRLPVLKGDAIYRSCPLSLWAARSDCNPVCCRWCGDPLPEDRDRFCSARCSDEANNNHVFDEARSERRRLDGYACVRCGSTHDLEVNHITPILGQHEVPGCWHHLAGLETLCHDHHLEVTARQRAAGEFSPSRRWAP